MGPLVTAAIPTYNRPKPLRRALQSVGGQTYDELDIIIVDDGSDECYVDEVVADVDIPYPVSVYKHSENRGLAAARNTAIHSADGQYVAFLDDDDQWEPTKIEKQVSTLIEDERAVCYTWLERLNHGNVTGRCTETHEGLVRTRLVEGGLTGPPAYCIKRDAILDLGGFNESLDRWQEWDFFLRLSDEYEFSCVPEVLLKVDASGTPSINHVQEKIDACERMIHLHAPLPERFGDEATIRFKSSLQFGVGSVALKAGDYKTARQYLMRSYRNDPSQTRSFLRWVVASGGKFTHKPALALKRRTLQSAHADR